MNSQKRGSILESPGFSEFRSLMDIYDTYLLEQENENSLRSLIDRQGLILFFQRDGEYYGAGEDGRIVFARIKNPDEGTPEGWEDEASFTAVNLTKLAKGEPSQSVFDKDDLKKMKVVDCDEVVDKLKSDTAESGTKLGNLKIISIRHAGASDRDDAPNFVRTDEE